MSKLPIDELEMPENLTEKQIAEFHRLTRAMGDARLIECDAAAVWCYLDAWRLTHEASEHLRNEGATILTPNGNVQISPWHSIHKTQSLLLIRWVRELGISPSGRKRLGVEVASVPDDDSDLLWSPPPLKPTRAKRTRPTPSTEAPTPPPAAPPEPPPPPRKRRQE